jgi:hypothetical protein
MVTASRRWLWNTLAVIGLLNFAVIFLVANWLGGDAVNGKEEGGRYYLANHGKLTEVTHAVWSYSRAHVYSVFVTHPIAMFAGFMSSREKRRSRTGNKQAGVGPIA